MFTQGPIESMGHMTNVNTWNIWFLSTDCYKICYFLKHHPNKNARKLNELCALQGDAENPRLAEWMKRDGRQSQSSGRQTFSRNEEPFKCYMRQSGPRLLSDPMMVPL